MTTCASLATALAGILMTSSAIAASFEGTDPFTCTPDEIVSCAPGAGCAKETAETINLPSLIVFDVAEKKITGVRPDGNELEATLDNVRHNEYELVFQGVQGRVVWSVTVAKGSGDMTLAAMGDGLGYIAFGACTLR